MSTAAWHLAQTRGPNAVPGVVRTSTQATLTWAPCIRFARWGTEPLTAVVSGIHSIQTFFYNRTWRSLST